MDKIRVNKRKKEKKVKNIYASNSPKIYKYSKKRRSLSKERKANLIQQENVIDKIK